MHTIGNSETTRPLQRAAMAFAGAAAGAMVLLSLLVLWSEALGGTAADPTQLMLGGGVVTVGLGGVAAAATRRRPNGRSR